MERRTRVLAVANSKGGVGKSTLATNIAIQAVGGGANVLLVDTDPQASSTLFASTRDETRKGFRVIQMTKPLIHREIPQLSAPYDLIVIDTAARESATFRSALAAATSILVPITPSAYDIWASEDVFTIIDELATTRSDLETLVVLNQVVPRTRIAADAKQALAELIEGQNVRILETEIHFRVAWKMACTRGLSVTEFQPSGPAAAELRALCRELDVMPALRHDRPTPPRRPRESVRETALPIE